ncbi:MAG: dTMP kinase [Patescibacteria group bacterium]
MNIAPHIVIDGITGCGKDTQISLLLGRALREGRQLMSGPALGGTVVGNEMRRVFLDPDLGMKAAPKTQCFMNMTSWIEQLKTVVWPYLDQAIPFVWNRGDSSLLAYQIYGLEAPELEKEFWSMMRPLVFGERTPSLYIFLEVLPVVAHERVLERKRGGGPGASIIFDAKTVEFYKRLHDGFQVFSQHPDVRAVKVDGNRSREEIHEDIYRIVSKECGWK